MSENVLWFTRIKLPKEIEELISLGYLKSAKERIKKMIEQGVSYSLKKRLEFELEKINRWSSSYPYDLKKALELLSKEMRFISDDEMKTIIGRGCIDYKIIEDEIRVYERFIPNMFWLCPELEPRRVRHENDVSKRSKEALKERVMLVSNSEDGYSHPLSYRVKMTIHIRPGSAPEGEKIRVWIPIPREDGINSDFKLISSSHDPIKISNELQRTIYFEDEMKVTGLSFYIEYQFISYGFKMKIDPGKVEDFDESSNVYKKYTIERFPHVVFTDYLVELTNKVTSDIRNPYLKAKRIWDWITHNVRYTFAHDYTLYDNISEYVARNKRGDCGMQALLFITMCRIAGIPARWQSSWYMNPIKHGMHDWAQFYIEPYGWLYADPSLGNLVKRPNEDWRNKFYFGNIEGYRLAANIEFSTKFNPLKTFFRSDPVDNQRGEVEWKGGNLFYDKWDYNFEILEVKKVKT